MSENSTAPKSGTEPPASGASSGNAPAASANSKAAAESTNTKAAPAAVNSKAAPAASKKTNAATPKNGPQINASIPKLKAALQELQKVVDGGEACDKIKEKGKKIVEVAEGNLKTARQQGTVSFTNQDILEAAKQIEEMLPKIRKACEKQLSGSSTGASTSINVTPKPVATNVTPKPVATNVTPKPVATNLTPKAGGGRRKTQKQKQTRKSKKSKSSRRCRRRM
jgi:hypothetical protein